MPSRALRSLAWMAPLGALLACGAAETPASVAVAPLPAAPPAVRRALEAVEVGLLLGVADATLEAEIRAFTAVEMDWLGAAPPAAAADASLLLDALLAMPAWQETRPRVRGIPPVALTVWMDHQTRAQQVAQPALRARARLGEEGGPVDPALSKVLIDGVIALHSLRLRQLPLLVRCLQDTDGADPLEDPVLQAWLLRASSPP